jgi:5'-3' exonuclease
MAINFADTMVEKPSNNLMVVDALNLAFRWKHQGKLNFADDYVNTVMSLAKSYNSGSVIIVADQGSSLFRKEIYPDYKNNRKIAHQNQTDIEKKEFEAFFKEFERTLDLLATKYPVFRYQGVEADDLAAWIVRNKSKYNFDSIWLISSDRDWDLLVADGVNRFSYVTRKEITVDTWDYAVSRDMYISYKCLIGDSGDNIPGIPGIGPKRAALLIEQYGDAMDIYEACPIAGKYKYIEALNENKSLILLNYELMDLVTFCEEAIGVENVRDLEWRLNEYRLQ